MKCLQEHGLSDNVLEYNIKLNKIYVKNIEQCIIGIVNIVIPYACK